MSITMPSTLKRLGCLVAALGLTASGCVSAPGSSSENGSWKPQGQVHMIVPFSAGGGSDIFGRAVASGIQKVSSLEVTTENHEGGSGAVGFAFVRSKKGNGRYLLAAETSLVALPMTTDLPYTWKSFTPLMQLAEDNNLLLVPKNSPIKSLGDVIERAKSGKFQMGVSGTSSPDAVVAALLEQEAHVDFREVIVQSGAEMVTKLLGGSVEAGILNPGEAAEQIKGGKLRAVAVFSDSRMQGSLSDIPTAKEQGVNVVFGQWRGIIGPPDMTKAQIDYWTGLLKKYTKSKAYQKYLEQNSLVRKVRSHEEFISYLSKYEKQLEQAFKGS